MINQESKKDLITEFEKIYPTIRSSKEYTLNVTSTTLETVER